jgi:hypothetical protein
MSCMRGRCCSICVKQGGKAEVIGQPELAFFSARRDDDRVDMTTEDDLYLLKS